MSDASPRYAFEDLQPGRELPLGTYPVTEEEVTAFAREFDPQPIHVDPAAAAAGPFGALTASGWHVCAMFMRMMYDAFLHDSTSQGAPGLEWLKWIAPVRAGDTLSGKSIIVDGRRSRSKPHMGFVVVRNQIVNQHGALVCEMQNTGMFLLRDPEAA
jgi:acyl dehydratase